MVLFDLLVQLQFDHRTTRCYVALTVVGDWAIYWRLYCGVDVRLADVVVDRMIPHYTHSVDCGYGPHVTVGQPWTLRFLCLRFTPSPTFAYVYGYRLFDLYGVPICDLFNPQLL